MLSFIYNEIFYRPLFNALAFLTNIIPGHDMGVAIIVLTILVRFVIFPFTHRSVKTQAKMRELEPELRDIKETHKENKEEQARQTMALYKKHGVSPLSGCLVMLVQLPFLIALYYVFWKGLSFDNGGLYSFITKPELVKMEFLGLILITTPSLFLAILAGVSQFFQVKLAQPALPTSSKKEGNKSFQNDFGSAMRIQMTYVLPVFIGFISYQLPAAVALYWTTMNLFAIVHESMVRIKAKKINFPNNEPAKQLKN